MKRILPVWIAICLLGAIFVCLPKSGEEKHEISTIDDLDGLTVGVQTGTNYELILQERCPDVKVSLFSDFSAMQPSVEQGRIDAYLTESESFMIEKLAHSNLVRVEEPLAHVECVSAVSKNGNSTRLLAELNEFIGEIKQNGVYQEIQDYWLEDYDPDSCTVDKSGITGENGVLMCTAEASYEPHCMIGKNGELIGYDVDFIYRFCRAYGYTPQIDPMDFESMSTALASGKYDLAVGLLPDEERAEEVLFTESYSEYDLIAVYVGEDTEKAGFAERLADSFEKTFIRDSRWMLFLQGTGTTLLIAALSVICGTGIGLLLYLWCVHGKRAEKRFTDCLCWLIGSTPTVVLLMILYYVVFSRYIISSVAVAVVGFSLMFGCEFYDNILSGVKAVGKGQEEAARAQGFSADQTFFQILLPQAAGHFFPSYQNNVVALIQETSVAGYITVMDLTKMSDLVRARTYDAFFPLLATAGIYFLVIWLISAVLRRLMLRFDNRRRTGERILRGISNR